MTATLLVAVLWAALQADPRAVLEKHCSDCHNAETKKGGLDLAALKRDFSDEESFARWVKVYDRIDLGEMPPKKRARPTAEELASIKGWLGATLTRAEQARIAGKGRTPARRMTRAEYENTIRDLFDMPGIALQGNLPADGSAHGFDKNGDALDLSHVNLALYVEAADHVLDAAIATQPRAPEVRKMRIPLSNPGAGVAHVLMHGDAVMLRDKKPDPAFPPPGDYHHIDQGAHQTLGMFRTDASVGLFRPEDESFAPYFLDFAALYPAHYRIRTSLWSYWWEEGKVLPARGAEKGRLSSEIARLSVVHLTHDGRHTGHPSTVLDFLDAPSLEAKEHERIVWLNPKDTIGFNTASLPGPVATRGKRRLILFKGPGIAVDWLDVEGPLYESWPPRSHKALFGDLPLEEFKGHRLPKRKPLRQEIGHALNRHDPVQGVWSVRSADPRADADRLLAAFLPRAFRRPVDAALRREYLAKVEERLKEGDCFETAMRWAYRAALCSPDFLFHLEPPAGLDAHALACRLSYFLWNSMPDPALTALAASGKLREPDVLRGEVERLLKDPRSQRFVEDFLGQWLKLRQISATDPDRKLYPEFSQYLQYSMVAETHAYFRELLDRDLDAAHLVRSDFVMVNEKMATHYGIRDVRGPQIRRVPLPDDCPRGGFLTQAAVLKVTANGTTTSPVPRGAFVMERFLGRTPDPPPPNVPAVEPDVRGATTIREQLGKHRSDPSCAACHAKIDPPGFALESFDVIGGFRTRYRSIDAGDVMTKKLPTMDSLIHCAFRLGPAVDSSGEMPDGRAFASFQEFQALLAADSELLLKNLTGLLAVYATGRGPTFGDREPIEEIVARTRKNGAGIRTLVHELVRSRVFQTK